MSDLVLRPDLIKLVKKNGCLYNPKHKHYKNYQIKTMVWEDIAAKLNVSVSRARELWRSLRDGYIRNKKALKSGKTSVYSWSEQLSFLDVADQKDSESFQDDSQHTVYFSEDIYAKIVDSPEQPAENWEGSGVSSPKAVPDYNGTASSAYATSQLYGENPKSRKRKSDAMDKVIDYLQSKKSKDAVDYLFMSYAKTFKSLTPRKQAILKVTLAKVFAEAEFGDLSSEVLNDK